MKNENIGTLLALLAAVISGISIPANKLFIVNLDPTVFTAIRAVIIGTIFFFISLYQSKFDLKNFKKVSWKYLFAIAIIGGVFAFLLFFNGLKLTTAGRGAFLHKTLPLYTVILAFFFLKEKITKKMIYALAIMFIGIIALYFSQINPAELWMNPSLGDLLIIGATFLWAIENIIARKAMIKGETNYIVSFARMFFGGLILFGFVLLFGKFNVLLTLSIEQWTNILISTGLLFGYVFFWYWSIKKINVSKATTLLLLSPVVSLILGILMFSEPLPLFQLIGSALILVGAYFVVGVKSEVKERI
jgi:drug/metabolite transporter (DMT)-like permease